MAWRRRGRRVTRRQRGVADPSRWPFPAAAAPITPDPARRRGRAAGGEGAAARARAAVATTSVADPRWRLSGRLRRGDFFCFLLDFRRRVIAPTVKMDDFRCR